MKAILVVDMPTICSNCILEQNGVINHKSYSYCGACGITTKHGHLLEDCPLRPLPETKDVGYPNEDYDVGFGDGWDACLKEITGETK